MRPIDTLHLLLVVAGIAGGALAGAMLAADLLDGLPDWLMPLAMFVCAAAGAYGVNEVLHRLIGDRGDDD